MAKETISVNIDPKEIEKFESLAQRWWDPNSEFRTLHHINPTRLNYINDKANLKNKTVIDIGCGGGILTQSMAELGAKATGLDPAKASITVAKLHALETGMDKHIRYIQDDPDKFAKNQSEKFDIVTALEILEHVPDYAQLVKTIAHIVKPGGKIFFSTINRHPKAYLLAILGAEYLMNILPRGTHEFQKFIKPSELSKAIREAGLIMKELVGFSYNPLTGRCGLSESVDVNYLIFAEKPN